MTAARDGKPMVAVALDRATDRLYKAVENHVSKKGGRLVVIRGIEIQEWPKDAAYTFRVAIRCAGRKPTFAEQTKRGLAEKP